MKRFINAALIALFAVAIPLYAKEWEDRKGKHVEGELVKYEDDIVYIRRKKDREVIRISIQNLVDEDQLYVMDTIGERQQAAKRAAEEAKKKAELAADDDDDGVMADDDDDDDGGVMGDDAEPDKGVAAIDGKAVPNAGELSPVTAIAGGFVTISILLVLILAMFVGWIWLLITAFRVGGCLWLLVCFICKPIGPIIFAVQHWEEAKAPFLLYVVSVGLIIIVQILAGLVFG